MKKTFLLFLTVLLVFTGCDKQKGPQTSYDPFAYEGNFENSELTVDGKMNEKEWSSSEYATPEYKFSYKSKIDNQVYNYSIRVYRGERELYAFFNVQDRNLLTYGDDNGTNVTYSDSCELYLNTQLHKNASPQTDDYQINMGIHNRTRVSVGNGSGWSTSSGIIQYEALVDGTINNESDVDKGYTLEMCIPYKQIGMTRDKEIGITFGIVDRYLSTGSMTSKIWYGASINGHFGSPQNPSAYFILKKNKIEIPPVAEYELEEDNSEYISDHSLVIPEGEFDGQVHNEITLNVSRKDNIITILGFTKENWQPHNGLFLLFDFGDSNRTSRDENTYCLRMYPGNKSIKDFYKYPNVGVNQTSLSIMMDDKHVFVSLNISKLIGEYEGVVNIAATSIENQNQAIVSQLVVDGRYIDQTNVSTFVQITSDNKINEYIDPFGYDSEKDATHYIQDLEVYTPNVENNGDEISKVTYQINREENTITILCNSESNWHQNELLSIYFDLGASGRTTYDGDVAILRFYPLTGSIKDFFYYPNIGLSKDNIQIYKNLTFAKVIVDLNILINENNEYVEDGIGLGIAVAHRQNAKILSFASFNGALQTTNLTTWPSIKKDNSITEAYNPNRYYPNDDTTNYNNQKNIIIPSSTNGVDNFEQINVSVNRTGYKVTILFENNNQKFFDSQMLLIQYDLGTKDRTVRDENTFILRCYPKSGEIKDFYRYPSGKATSDFISIKTNDRFIQITIDFAIISQDIANYVDEGIGLNFANCDKSASTVLKYCTVDGQTLNTNPSKWIRLDKQGNYVE